MTKGEQCHITKSIDELSKLIIFVALCIHLTLCVTATGTLAKLPGNNPLQREGVRATMFLDPNPPTLLAPVYAYTGNTPPAVGKPVSPISSTNTSSSTGGVNPTKTSISSSNLDIASQGNSSMVHSHPLSPVDASPENSSPHTDLQSHSSTHVPTPASSSASLPQSSSFSASGSTGPKCKSNRKRQPRSFHHARAYHEKGRRLMKPHGWAS
jgi:hypothetical protein